MYDAGQYLLCVANKQILDCVEVTGNIVGETMTVMFKISISFYFVQLNE